MTRAVRIILGMLFVWLKLNAMAGVDPTIHFIENKRQWPGQVYYGAELPGTHVFFLNDGIVFNLHEKDVNGHNSIAGPAFENGHEHGGYVSTFAFKVTFAEADVPIVSATGKLMATYNYYFGKDRSAWSSGVSSYTTILYRQLYKGIDLRISSDQMRMKSDWVVEPCGNPDQIRLSYTGVESLSLVDENLMIKTELGEVAELKPYAYQMINGQKRAVACHYKISGNESSFSFPDGYDTNYELVIDPILIFSGYSGSTYDNWGNTATYDSKGNLYSGGMVTDQRGGSGFPTTIGAYQTFYAGGNWDVAILKYDSSGANLLYATYLGGSGTETPQSLVVNKDDELFILGATGSADFPVTNNSSFKGGTSVDPLWGVLYENGSDLFVVRLQKDGSALLASTYLGGTQNDGLNFVSGYMNLPTKVESEISRNYGDQMRGDIICDSNGNVLIASNTMSSDFPLVNSDKGNAYHGGTHDGVVVKLPSNLSDVVWSRFMGGPGTDATYSIKTNKDNEVYVAGGTTSSDFAGMNGLHKTLQGSVDGWIARLSEDGSQFVNGTYVGTAAYDQSYFIDLATDGNVLTFGQTQGAYPVVGKVYSNPNSGQFIHKLSSDLSTTLFSTVIGSGIRSPNISPTAFLVSECNTIYLSGWGGAVNTPLVQNPSQDLLLRNYVGGSTFNLPVTPDAYQSTTHGSDFYLMVLSGDASEFMYGTFFGGNSSSTHVDGGTSRFDKRGIVYHAVCAGCGGLSDFPAVNVPLERQFNNSQRCNNAAFKFDLSLLKARIQTNNLALSQPGYNRVCYPDSIVFQNKSTGGKFFVWDFGDGTTSLKTDALDIHHHYKTEGKYTIKLKAVDDGTCVGKDSTYATVLVFQPMGFASDDQTICFDTSAKISASGGVAYEWTSQDGEFTSHEASPTVKPGNNTTYTVAITDVHGCQKRDSVVVKVVPGIDLKYEWNKEYDDCYSRPALAVTNLSDKSEEVFFDFGDGTTSDLDQVTHIYENDGMFSFRMVGKKDFCVYEKKEEISIYTLHVPNVITPDQSPGKNDSFKILWDGQPVSAGVVRASLLVYNRWGEDVFFSDNYQGDWSGEGLSAGVYYYEVIIEQEKLTCKGWVQIIR